MVPRLLAIATALTSITPHGAIVAQMLTRLHDPTECPFAHEEWAAGVKVECRRLVVPQSRNREDTTTLRLFVVVLRADRPSGKPPIVMLHGGPGESALLPMARWGRGQGPLDRDIVVYDQRGAGLSEPDPCPAYTTRLRNRETTDAIGGATRGALQDVARECVTTMRARGIDPA